MNGNQWLPGKVFKYIQICKTVKPPFRNSEKNVKYSCANTCTNTLVRTFLKKVFYYYSCVSSGMNCLGGNVIQSC